MQSIPMVVGVVDRTFFTAAGRQTIMAFGGKNSDIDGYMPYTFSTDGGASFAKGAKLPCVYTHG